MQLGHGRRALGQEALGHLDAGVVDGGLGLERGAFDGVLHLLDKALLRWRRAERQQRLPELGLVLGLARQVLGQVTMLGMLEVGGHSGRGLGMDKNRNTLDFRFDRHW